MTTITSSHAHRAHLLSGMRTQRERVLACIVANAPCSRRQIKELTGIEINAVCGRVNTLLKSDLVRVLHESRDPLTGKVVEYLVPVVNQGELG